MRTFSKLFIGGQWVQPSSSSVIEVISPHSEEIVGRVPEAQKADIDRAVAAARDAFDNGPWPRMTQHERADVMDRLLAALQQRSADMAVTITTEMGCPISFSNLGQVMASNMVLGYYAQLARTYQFEDMRAGMLGPALVRREPVGVVGAIVPWNVPQFVIMLKLGPALAAGATVVLKPAPETPLDAMLLAEAAEEAGVPAGVLNIVPAGREVGEHLVTHDGVDKISFTGSTAAGKRIAGLCGERLKRVTLELGGKSAAILLEDTDFATTAAGLLPASMMNTGQACAAQTRILVPKSRMKEATDALIAAVAEVKTGDPMDPETFIGPLVAQRQRERVEGYIALGKKEGATVAIGGGRPAGLSKGWYVQPTVFTDVKNSMRIAREEIFGPVICVIPYNDVDEAVRIANDSDYGLSGSVWTADIERGIEIAQRVRTGTYTVNGFLMEFSAPFGGYKCSGIGRELGPEGLNGYLESKTINLPMGYERPAV
jgi:betaine-aldehyde dehydrogenase